MPRQIFSLTSLTSLFLFCAFCAETFACSPQLVPYPFECEMQDRYHKVRAELSNDWNVTLEDLYFYKTSRFIDQKTLANAIQKEIPANQILSVKEPDQVGGKAAN